MRFLVPVIILMMSWEPSCRPDSSPTASGWAEPDYSNDPGGYSVTSVFKGKVLDDSTGDCIDSAKICSNVMYPSCQRTDQYYKGGYQIKFNCSSCLTG